MVNQKDGDVEEEDDVYEPIGRRFVQRPNYISWAVFLLFLLGAGFFVWHERNLYSQHYYDCAKRYQVNLDFSEHAICNDPQRERFEREGRLDCTGAEKYTFTEPPVWCAFRCWLPASSIGIAVDFVRNTWGTMTGYLGIGIGVFILSLVTYLLIKERGETKRYALSLEAQQETFDKSVRLTDQIYQRRQRSPRPAPAMLPDVSAHSPQLWTTNQRHRIEEYVEDNSE
jgi:hypothetical protein